MIYKLYGAISTLDGISQLDIQDDGFIVGICFVLCPAGMDGAGDIAKSEISFMSSNTFLTNDTRGSIAQHCVTNNFLTSGGGCGSNSLMVSGLNIPINAGERLFMHGKVSSGVSGDSTIYVFVTDGSSSDKNRPPRRRR